MPSTRFASDADIAELLDDLVTELRDILVDRLVGVYVFGSLATGAFVPHVSDLDLVAALAGDLTDDEFARLDRLHAAMARRWPRWDDRIEIGYIAVKRMRRIAADDSIALISPGEPFHRKRAGTDWLFNLAVLHQHGITLLGPAPTCLIDPVPPEELRGLLPTLMREWIAWLSELDREQNQIALRAYQGFMVVTLCRSLYLWRTGAMASKREAATWAARAYPEWAALVADAVGWQKAAGEADAMQPATVPRTLRFVRFAIETILGGQPEPSKPFAGA